MNTRIERIVEIAKNNAYEALNDIENKYDYETNMRQTVAEVFPDWTTEEAIIMEETYFGIVNKT